MSRNCHIPGFDFLQELPPAMLSGAESLNLAAVDVGAALSITFIESIECRQKSAGGSGDNSAENSD
jgi:hypothetical protein